LSNNSGLQRNAVSETTQTKIVFFHKDHNEFSSDDPQRP